MYYFYKLSIIILIILFSNNVLAKKLNNQWSTYKSLYYKLQERYWPNLKPKNLISSQIYMESHWDPHAELKTNREYGFGFGQMTKAWNKYGKIRFNKFEEAKKRFRELKTWKWEDRFNAEKQIIFVLLEDRYLYKSFDNFAKDHLTQYALMLSAYNGGKYFLMKEIALCKADPKCDHRVWFCNIETKAARSTKKWKGYGKSFFSINREYPINILFKYIIKIK